MREHVQEDIAAVWCRTYRYLIPGEDKNGKPHSRICVSLRG